MLPTVLTFDSRDDAIMGALEAQWVVKVILKMAGSCTIGAVQLIHKRTIFTLKMVDTVFFAVTVITAPILQGLAF